MESDSGARVAAQPIKGRALARVWALALIYFLAPFSSLLFSIETSQALRKLSSDSPAQDFVIRLKDGQRKFRQGETITVELGYGASPQAPAKRYADRPDQPGLAVDRFVLTPHTAVVDPLRDFLGTVGGWDGPPPRKVPFAEAGGSWTTADINEWFRFDNPGNYTLLVLAHAVRTSYEAYGSRPSAASTVKSNTVEFEIVPADAAWQAATLQKALGLLETKSADESQQQGCRILRFLATPLAVDNMVEHYADIGICEADYRDGLFAFPDRAYAVRKLENGILEPSIAVSAGYLDTLARLSAYLQHPEFLPGVDDQQLGTSEWSIGGPMAGHWELIEAEQDRYVRELVGALDNKLVGPRALCLKAIFDSPMLHQPTLLKSIDSALLAKLRKEIAASFTELPISEQSMLLYIRWENIASPAMIPVLKGLYENPPPGSNEQFIAFVLDDLFRLDPAEGRSLLLTEMKSPAARLDLRFVRLLPEKEIPELDNPLVENLEAGKGDEDTIWQLIGRYATPAVFPRVLAVEERRADHLSCEAQAAFLTYAVKSDPVQGAAMLDERLSAHNGCSVMALSEVASRQMTPEIERLAIAYLGDSDALWAASAATTLGRYGSVEAEQPLWNRLEKWHARWAGHASELPNGFGSALQNGLETALESSLIEALGSGQAWFAGPDELGRLARLCVSSGGCQRVQEIATEAETAPNINVYGSEPNYHASVAQYQVDSIDSLKRKLAQFPEGTIFTWSFSGDEKEGASILADLGLFLKGYGMTIL
jgi:hypothetical protein